MANNRDFTAIPISDAIEDREFPSIDDLVRRPQLQNKIKRKQQQISTSSSSGQPLFLQNQQQQPIQQQQQQKNNGRVRCKSEPMSKSSEILLDYLSSSGSIASPDETSQNPNHKNRTLTSLSHLQQSSSHPQKSSSISSSIPGSSPNLQDEDGGETSQTLAKPQKSHQRATSKVNQHIKFLQNNLKNVHAKKVMKKIAPTRIPIVERAVRFCKRKWPGRPKYGYVLRSPYFFLYVISMGIIQAFVAAVSVAEIQLWRGYQIGDLVSTTFFGLYIIEVIFRMYVKGFYFFLSIYNLSEVGLTLSAFILDFKLQGTSFVANVLSLRVIWGIHKVPGMGFIVEGLKIAAPRISIIIFPLLILIYVFAVIATSTLGPASYPYSDVNYWQPTYNHTFPNGTSVKLTGAGLDYDYYGDISKSMFTLFQVMTGDGWASSIARETMETRPWSFILFIIFYSLFAFVLLNIFTGIMVDAIQSYEKQRRSEEFILKALKKDSGATGQGNGKGRKKSTVSSIGSGDSSLSEHEKEDDINPTLPSSSVNDHISILRSNVLSSSNSVLGEDTSRRRKSRILSSAGTIDSQLENSGKNGGGGISTPALAIILREIQSIHDEMTNMQTRIMTRIALLETKMEEK